MSEETEKAYWEGYIQKQNEAVEICKQCKYRKKARELEDYITKDKIREKIKELNKNRDMISGGYTISILEELLEGK